MKDQRDGPLAETTGAAVPGRGQARHAGHRVVDRGSLGHGPLQGPAGNGPFELGGFLTGTCTAGHGLASVFKARAGALGARVCETSRDGLRDVLDEIVGRHGPAVVEPGLIAAFPALDGLGDSTPDDPRLTAATCGVTAVEYAIAETGSLVMASGASRGRQFSSVPPVHVAVIERRRLVPDLLDVLLAYGGRDLPPGFIVLTGPGRGTESAPSRGRYGPKTVECVLVD